MAITIGKVDVTNDMVDTDVTSFLRWALPDVGALNIVKGQINRVPPPPTQNYVVFTPNARVRLSTNIQSFSDVLFTASASGTTLIVTDIAFGVIQIGAALLGVGVTNAPVIVQQLGGASGGVGTYKLSKPVTLSSQLFAAGLESLLMPTRVVLRFDFFGPLQDDNAQVVSTLWRSERGVDFFTSQGHGIAPLYSGDAHQVPFINESNQYEYNWQLDAHLQINPAVMLSQQFASNINAEIIDVDVWYPPV